RFSSQVAAIEFEKTRVLPRRRSGTSAPGASPPPRGSAGRGGPVAVVTGEQPGAGSVPPHHEPEAVVLDLVQPARAARRALGDGKQGSSSRVRSRISVVYRCSRCLRC